MADSRLENFYRSEFVALNVEFKQLVTVWQLTGATPDRLYSFLDSAMPMFERLASLQPELRDYGIRFERATSRVLQGDTAWLTGVFVDSAHSVWFELHTALLDALGFSRLDVDASNDE
ncbi:hypothetical protein [Nocardia sp. NPDC052316]|uniref:hypothetical protein n=1 Tax=Nocardia sp. NPDC052316 TaxID=3364329 RepID=UPI0037C8FBAF